MSSQRVPAFFRRVPFLLCLAVLLAFGATPALAGGDDFEFGRALASMGKKTGDRAFFDYARRVFTSVIEDPNRSDADKDECRYGIAEMRLNEALGAAQNPAVPYKDVSDLFTEAITTMESFVSKNPTHKRAAEAKLKVGTTRLAFVQWARDQLLPEPEVMAERGTNGKDVQAEAESMVRGAIGYFDALRKGYDSMDPSEMSQMAQYYWVLCQYYLALVYEPQSKEAKHAFEDAIRHLDDFISLNDGQLLAVYAQDIFGLTFWELAKIAETEEEKVNYYRKAVEWFETCIETPNEGPEWEQVITNGYYHLGQVCLEAGRIGGENFHRRGSDFLMHMETRNPTAWRTDSGIRAMVEWAKIEHARDRTNEAIEICRRAGEHAKKLGKGYLEGLVNRQLRKMLSGGGSGSSISADPSVLKRVADDFFMEQKWSEAIAAYKKVVASVPRTRENVDTFLVPTWERIASAYRRQDDYMAAALAYEPIHDIWVDDMVKKTGTEDDPNTLRFGDLRRRAMATWKELYDRTGSAVYHREFKAIRDSFPKDYPGHPSEGATQWNTAREHFTEARKLKAAKDSKWRSRLKSAEEGFREVSRDMRSRKQDAAFVHLIHAQYLRDNWKGMLNAYKAAKDFWDSKEAKAQAKAQPTIAERRLPEMGRASYWMAEALYRLAEEADERNDAAGATRYRDQLIKALEGWHVTYEVLRGSDKGPYYSGTLGHLVMAWIGKGDIPKADTYYRRLLKEDPKYFRLPKITFKLADHFNDKARVIDAKRKEARAKLNGTVEEPTSGAKYKLRVVTRDEFRTVELLVDLRKKKSKLEELIRVYEKAKANQVDTDIPKDDYENAQKEVPELAKRIAGLNTKANRQKAEKEKLEKEVTELDAKVRELAQQLYEPVVSAANYFKDWDDVLKLSGQQRIARNVEIFAGLFYDAARLRPENEENWVKARELYEDYLKLEDDDQEKRHEAKGRLGTIYAQLAEAAPAGSERRSKLVQKALDRLQGSLADLPENNDLVVGMLAGEVVVIPWRQEPTAPITRFPMPRVTSVKEFRNVVANLGTPGGAKIPLFKSESANREYGRLLTSFKNYIEKVVKDAELEKTVQGFAVAGFDMPFFRLHAEANDEFRLSLAWIYSESGDFTNMTKAINLANSLVRGNYAAPDDSEMWWAAQSIKLKSLVTGAALKLKAASGPADPTAADWVERASKMLRGLSTQNPYLGDDVRPQTRKEFKALLARLESLRGQVGKKPLNLILEVLAPVEGPEDAPEDQPKEPK